MVTVFILSVKAFSSTWRKNFARAKPSYEGWNMKAVLDE